MPATTLEPAITPDTDEVEIPTTVVPRCCVCSITHGVQACDNDACTNFICEEHQVAEHATCCFDFVWCPNCAEQRLAERRAKANAVGEKDYHGS